MAGKAHTPIRRIHSDVRLLLSRFCMFCFSYHTHLTTSSTVELLLATIRIPASRPFKSQTALPLLHPTQPQSARPAPPPHAASPKTTARSKLTPPPPLPTVPHPLQRPPLLAANCSGAQSLASNGNPTWPRQGPARPARPW